MDRSTAIFVDGAPLPVEPATGAGRRGRDGAGGGRGARAAAERAGLRRAQARGPARLLRRRRRGHRRLRPGKNPSPPRLSRTCFAVQRNGTTTTLLDEVRPEFDVAVFSGWLRRDFPRKIARTSKGSA